MESETNQPILTVACRFVPYDQWLITHLNPSWSVKQVKHWILSKCNLVDAPDLPRCRTASPITFASHSRGGSLDMSNSDDSDDEGGNESSSVEGGFRSSRRTRNFADSWPSQLPRRKSESFIHDSPPDKKDSDLASRYTILTFSNTHVLDDDYVFSFYGIRPYELLEIHPAGSIVRLPREVMVQYVRPYFEARVMALRAVRTDSFPSDREGLADRVAARRSKNGKIGKGRLVSSDPLVYGMFGDKNEPKKKNKKVTKTEWKERWVVIHQGVLSLCSDRLDPNPSIRIPLTSIIAFRGAEHLAKPSTSLVAGQRIVCAKFRPSHQKHVVKSASAPSSSTLQHTTGHPRPTVSSYVTALQSPTSSPSSHTRIPVSSFPSSTSSSSRSHASVTPVAPTTRDPGYRESPIDQPRRDGLQMMLGFVGGSGTRGHGEKAPDMEMAKARRDGRKNVTASSSASEFDEDDEVERKRAEKGKGKAIEAEDAKETQSKDMNEQKEHEWLVLDMCDDNAFTAILRILHRHSQRPTTSSFLPQSSTLISNTVHSSASPPSQLPPTSFNTPMTFISPFSNSIISPFDSSTMYPTSLGTIPYPEWRMEAANRARKSGLGCLDKVMAWFLGDEQDDYSRSSPVNKDSRLASGSRPRRNTVKSTTSDGTVGAHDVVSVRRGEDSDGESDDAELSECEWEGWMRDLDRQEQVEERRVGETQEGTTSGVGTLSPSPSSRSSVDSIHNRPYTHALSPQTASSSTLSPSTVTCSSSSTHTGQDLLWSRQSIVDGSNVPVPPNPMYLPTTVSTNSEPNHVRRRSSTVTAGGTNVLRKKDRAREKEMASPQHPDGKDSAPNTNTIKKKKSILSKPHLSLTFPDLSSSDVEDFQLARTATTSQSPPRTSILRHVRSASNLQRSIRAQHPEANGAQDPGVPTATQGERKTGIMTGVSAQAGQLLAKGWDSTLGFVDGRVGFGAGSFYG